MCAIVNAIGNAFPPVFIFPRARFHDSMLSGAPVGSIGFANSPTSGWMTGPLFLKVLEHLHRLSRCTKDDPILLLMDNHESHCTYDAITYCRENGIVLLTFPPHCTHRLQPLDVAVMGPFKQKLAVAQNDWLRSHPGRTITIHDLAGIVTTAYNVSFVTRNIVSGFVKPGIFPFNRNAFADENFESAEVTNRPLPATVDQEPQRTPVTAVEVFSQIIPPTINQTADEIDMTNFNDGENPEPRPVSPSVLSQITLDTHAENIFNGTVEEPSVQSPARETENLTAKKFIITPEFVRPLPLAPPRKESNRGRKKGKSRILTDTPEKDEVYNAYISRRKTTKKVTKEAKKKLKKKGDPDVVKRKIFRQTKTALIFSSSEESDFEMVIESEEASIISSEDEEMFNEAKKVDQNEINVGDYVLAELTSSGKKMTLAFVARVVECNGQGGFMVVFLKKGVNKFYFPEKEDKSFATISDILAKLPPPIHVAGTSRTASMISFKFNFSMFKLG